MYTHIKEKLNISEDRIRCLIEDNADYQELFDDYELLCTDLEKNKTDFQLQQQYLVLKSELENEIQCVICKYNSQKK